jgi:hypothetical protein
MTPDKEFDIVAEDASPPRHLIHRLTALHPHLRRIVLKVLNEGQSTPRKCNGIKFEGKAPPDDSPDAIAELLTHMAIADYDSHEKPPKHYEAVCEIVKDNKKVLKYIRFKVDPSGMLVGATDDSEIEVLLRAAMTFVQEVSTQNKELHETLLEHSKVLQQTTVPYKDALQQMGEITSNAFKQTAYALFLVMDTQRQDKELEIGLEKWRETMGLASEFLPKAIKQKIERMVGAKFGSAGKKDDEEVKDGKEKTEDSEKGDDAKAEDESPISLAEGCQAFGASLTASQWPAIRKALKAKELELFEKVVNSPESASDEEVAKDVNKLRKVFDTETMKASMLKVFTVEQLGVLSGVLERAKRASRSKERSAQKTRTTRTKK